LLLLSTADLLLVRKNAVPTFDLFGVCRLRRITCHATRDLVQVGCLKLALRSGTCLVLPTLQTTTKPS